MRWRIGSVPYLNARPLIYGLENQVTLCEPARLADMLHARQFDVGLVPVAEVLRHPQYDLVDGIAIAARRAVRSVFLAHRLPLEQLRRVAIDPASRTSVWLLRVLLKVGFHIEPEFYPRPPGAELTDHEAMLLIGDEAIRYATRPDAPRVWDLGEAWGELTGLPFVFAGWAVQRDGVADRRALAHRLTAAKANGLAHLEEIVQNAPEAAPEFLREYFTHNVCYDLGDAEKTGLRRFQQYLKELGLIEECHGLRYIS